MAKRSEWVRTVQRWRRSGLTSSEFSAREGLNAGTLLWWSSRLRREARGRAPLAFVEVAAVAAGPVEVELTNGRIVRVPSSFDEDSLRRLFALAEQI